MKRPAADEAARAEAERTSPGPSVLLVDDEEAILFAVGEYLTANGWQVATAGSAEAALELVSATPFAAAVVDLRLSVADDPGSGLEVVRAIRRRSAETRIVLLTAYGSPAVEAEARRLRIDSLLAKPQPLAELDRHLRRLLAGDPTGSAAPPG